jgi:hypothetical protein
LGFRATRSTDASRRVVFTASHAGVYAVGHPILAVNGQWMAAVLACGRGAALGYAPAAAFRDLRRRHMRHYAGAHDPRLRRHRHRPRARVRARPGREAGADRVPRPRCHRTSPRAASRIRAPAPDLATYEAGTSNTRSDLEKPFLALGDEHGLPRPLVNQPLCGMTVDFVFAEQRVAVESDSWKWHGGRAAFERDRQRDALLAAAGYTCLRFTDRQIELAPYTVVKALVTALPRRAA